MKLQAKTKEQREHISSLLTGVSSVGEDGVSTITGTISYDEMSAIVDYLRQPQDKRKDLFEECWVAYSRKGSKKKALDQWARLKDEEKDAVLPHIKAYVSSRERQFQKDFERYLRDRTFNDVVLKGNEVYYDPSVAEKFNIADEEECEIENVGSVTINGQIYR